jgi:microsomal dipeptidase-like Zn-dependent dipeptidase
MKKENGSKHIHRTALSALLVSSALLGAHCSASSNVVSEPPDDLWGFADLHAHPAFHLAYGATVADASDLAEPGIMYGLPGLALDAGTEDADLQGCDGRSHGSANPLADILLTQLSIVLKTPHGPSGYPSFDNWPGATAGLHQQMHVTWLRRAFDGGQRLMVASVVENALLAAVYSGRVNLPASPAIHVDERKAVDAQVDYIKRLVAANSDWLSLAMTSDDAKLAIHGQKMAIVLGTEFDTLDMQEMNDLWDAGVRVFIPIHLADNDLGGTAVYTDIFNLHNAYVRGVGYEITTDPTLEFELNLDLSPIELLGLPLPNPFNNANVGVPPGHRNKKGLSDPGTAMIKALIDKGAIIDVAHMGEQSTDDTLSIAESYKTVLVPVMESHTSVRPDPTKAKGETERDLSLGNAQRIGKLGGMLGISTGGNTSDENVSGDRIFYQTPFAKITNATPYHEESLPPTPPPHAVCKGLLFQAWTADDDLREAASLLVNGTKFFINKVGGDTFTIHNDESITRMVAPPRRIGWEIGQCLDGRARRRHGRDRDVHRQGLRAAARGERSTAHARHARAQRGDGAHRHHDRDGWARARHLRHREASLSRRHGSVGPAESRRGDHRRAPRRRIQDQHSDPDDVRVLRAARIRTHVRGHRVDPHRRAQHPGRLAHHRGRSRGLQRPRAAMGGRSRRGDDDARAKQLLHKRSFVRRGSRDRSQRLGTHDSGNDDLSIRPDAARKIHPRLSAGARRPRHDHWPQRDRPDEDVGRDERRHRARGAPARFSRGRRSRVTTQRETERGAHGVDDLP